MKTQHLAIALSAAILATSAHAQSTPPATTPPTMTPPAVTEPLPPAMRLAGPTLTDSEAKALVDKIVYSSDNKNLGEVAAILRDPSGHVTELHADVGGFLGFGETRVRVMPDQFRVDNGKVVLNVTADQAKKLPQIAK